MRLALLFSPVLLAFCTHAGPAPDRVPRDVVYPNGTCCHRELRSYGIEEPNPFGGPPARRVPATLHCPLRFEDGITESVSLHVRDLREVVFEDALPDDARCSLCYPQLRMHASVQASAPEHGIQLVGDALLIQIDADARIEFLLQQGELFADGELLDGSQSTRIARGRQHGGEHVIARSAGPCVGD